MNTWLQRTGYPILSITELKPPTTTTAAATATANAQGSVVRRFHVKQRRFLADGSKEETAEDSKQPLQLKDSKGRVINREQWVLPISVVCVTGSALERLKPFVVGASARSTCGVVEAEFEVTVPSAQSVLKFNAAQSGFYRIEYTTERLQPLLSAGGAVLHALSPADRLGVQG
jgi:hypothetical protein